MSDRRDEPAREVTRNPIRFLHFIHWPGWFPDKPIQWLGPLLAAAMGALLLGVILVVSGIPNLAASTPHPSGWARFLHFTFRQSVAFHEPDRKPADFGTPAMIAKGAGYYGMACAHCHAGPGLGQNPVALSLRPRPQYLMREIGSFSDAALFQIVKHGVKYSAMPAWPVQDRDDEVWAVVSFLRAMPKLTTTQFKTLVYGDRSVTGAAIPQLTAGILGRPYRAGTPDGSEAVDLSRTSPALGFDEFSLTGDVGAYCTRCHVNGGAGMAGGAVPNLTILDRDYMRQALTRYATGVRSSAFMQVVATQLSPQQIDALAAIYTRSPRRLVKVAQPPALVATGERIIAQGIGAARRDACSNCHDISRGVKRAFPVLDGQNLMYLRGRMLEFRQQAARGGGRFGNPMIAIAGRLTPQQIDAVSAAYAAHRGPGGVAQP